ncbi:hypothetical protein GCM10009836_05470 [Pseudonocardia ailaonensis]|uniref:PspA domain-containing protein n=1 Tax=Pseudonocardia ailaonensis TaxID=367279 RepID=A0ABN2MLA8_9PSEU
MTEPTPSVPEPEDLTPEIPGLKPDYDEHGVPSLDYVRDKIEGRAATAIGWEELAGGTEQVQSAEEKFAEREQKGKDKLAEIRRQMGL